MNDARRLTLEDVRWAVDRLRRRRRTLEPHAPVFWNPAPDAVDAHIRYLTGLVEQGAQAWRTEGSVLVAAPAGEGLVVDDAAVDDDRWDDEGAALWSALSSERAGTSVTFLAPRYEPSRLSFALSRGLTVSHTWWLRELEARGGAADADVTLPAATARTVAAPPVYAPGGPMLLLTSVSNPGEALPAALSRAADLGCAGVVVQAHPSQADLTDELGRHGFRAHCDFLTGLVR